MIARLVAHCMMVLRLTIGLVFAGLTKADESRQEVEGIATTEEPSRQDEILDEPSKPLFPDGDGFQRECR
jgi:hypothetical protein